MKRISIAFILLHLGLVGGCSRFSQTPIVQADEDQDVIRIGEISPLTGPDAAAGISIKNGVELYVEKINQGGGIFGRKIELIALDDQGKAEQSALVISKLIAQKKIQAIIGTLSSSGTLAMAPLAQRAQIPLVTSTATHPRVTEMGDSIFRVCFTELFQGDILATFAFDKLKARRVAILYDHKSEYSIGLAQIFAKNFEKRGGIVVANQSYSSGDIDFKAQLTLIRSKNPDILLLPNYFTDVGLIARQVRELGVQIPLLGGDAWDSPKLIEIGGKSVENGYFSNHYSDQQSSVEVQTFIEKYRSKYGTAPDGPAALSYDAAGIVLQAVGEALAQSRKENRILDKTDIRKNLSMLKNYLGVTGKITMDSHRNPIKSSVILKVENGRFNYQTTLNPEIFSINPTETK